MSTGPDNRGQVEAPAPPLRRGVPLALEPDAFRRAGHALVDRLAMHFATLDGRRLTAAESPVEVRAALDACASLPAVGADPEVLLAETAELLMDHSLFNAHPLFFGYVTSPPAPIGVLGDLLASGLNANVAAWRLAPAASEVEAQAVRWIAELLGYPTDCGGIFVSGGNMANMVALFTARVAAADWDVRRLGMADPAARRMRVYASTETHTWLQKGAALAGIGSDSVRWIAADDGGRMDVAALRRALAEDRAAGVVPLMVVGTAGTVSTGAVDPLYELAQVCRDNAVWLHVDGAYGAFAAAVPGTPRDLGALGLADSVAVDPHKWLYAPIEAGCVLVRDRTALQRAFSYRPVYYELGDEAVNYLEHGPQNSRGFRALKVWLALKQVGRDGYVAMIGDDLRLCRRLHARVAEHPELEALTLSLSISTFRYLPPDLEPWAGECATADYLDVLNRELLERIQDSGEAFVSNAVVAGRYALRACIVNFHTGEEHVDALPGIVVRLGREVDRQLRSPWMGARQAA